jgi:hypothetical protein
LAGEQFNARLKPPSKAMDMRRRIVCLLMVLSPAIDASLAAQESIAVVPVARETVELKSGWLSILRVVSTTGATDDLAKTAAEFLLDLGTAFRSQRVRCCDLTKNYYLVLFISTDSQGKPTLVHVLLHNPQPNNGTLLGVRGPDHKVIEIFLAEDQTVTIQGAYAVEQVENPALKQLDDFVTTVIGKVTPPTTFTNLSSKANTFLMIDGGARNEAKVRLAVTLSTVELTHARAKLAVKHSVVIAQPIAHMSAVVSSTAGELRLKYGETSLDAALRNIETSAEEDTARVMCTELISLTEKTLRAELAADACAFSIADEGACIKKLKSDLDDVFKAFKPTTSCPVDEARTVVSAFLPALSDVTRVTGTTTLTNTPLQRYSFGLATGYIGGITTHADRPRVQIQSNKIAANPFTRGIAMGLVNLPVWGYDSSTFEPRLRERVRPFVAFPFSPYFGLSAGASYALTRSIAANIGYARLWYETPKVDEHLDQAPVNTRDPFTLAGTNAWFIAAGYNFGK